MGGMADPAALLAASRWLAESALAGAAEAALLEGLCRRMQEIGLGLSRVSVGIDTLQKDIVMAGAGTYSGPAAGTLSYFMAPIMPYKAFGNTTDPESGVYFRTDAISLLYVPPTPSQTTISQDMPQPSAELKVHPQPNCPGGSSNDLCGFEIGDRLIIFDAEGNWDLFTVTQVQDAAAHLQHQGQPFTVGYATGSNVTIVLPSTPSVQWAAVTSTVGETSVAEQRNRPSGW